MNSLGPPSSQPRDTGMEWMIPEVASQLLTSKGPMPAPWLCRTVHSGGWERQTNCPSAKSRGGWQACKDPSFTAIVQGRGPPRAGPPRRRRGPGLDGAPEGEAPQGTLWSPATWHVPCPRLSLQPGPAKENETCSAWGLGGHGLAGAVTRFTPGGSTGADHPARRLPWRQCGSLPPSPQRPGRSRLG